MGQDGVDVTCDDDDVTRRLETAVRRISRGSPNRSPLLGNSPKTSAAGLSGLARGYEQYREWVMTNLTGHTTEFAEASSDDLSSEWEACSEIESINNNSISGLFKSGAELFGRPGTPSLGPLSGFGPDVPIIARSSTPPMGNPSASMLSFSFPF